MLFKSCPIIVECISKMDPLAPALRRPGNAWRRQVTLWLTLNSCQATPYGQAIASSAVRWSFFIDGAIVFRVRGPVDFHVGGKLGGGIDVGRAELLARNVFCTPEVGAL